MNLRFLCLYIFTLHKPIAQYYIAQNAPDININSITKQPCLLPISLRYAYIEAFECISNCNIYSQMISVMIILWLLYEHCKHIIQIYKHTERIYIVQIHAKIAHYEMCKSVVAGVDNIPSVLVFCRHSCLNINRGGIVCYRKRAARFCAGYWIYWVVAVVRNEVPTANTHSVLFKINDPAKCCHITRIKHVDW